MRDGLLLRPGYTVPQSTFILLLPGPFSASAVPVAPQIPWCKSLLLCVEAGRHFCPKLLTAAPLEHMRGNLSLLGLT